MKVLLVGVGGREHAIARKLSNATVHAVGGWRNPGIPNVHIIDINNVDTVLQYAVEKGCDIAIVGSENQLALGMADTLNAAGVYCFGPTAQHARIETDKAFARSLIPEKYNPQYTLVTPEKYSDEYLQDLVDVSGGEYVIKAVGLRGGKGVKLSGLHLANVKETTDWCKQLLKEDGCFLFEQRLYGQEFTLMCMTDGNSIVHMPVVQDFKLLNNGNTGPQTGGMGCITHCGLPPFLTAAELAEAQAINVNVLQRLPGYHGVLYGSFMKTSAGLKVIEYNARFGDPEAINIMQLLQTDFCEILAACRDQRLGTLNVEWSDKAMLTTCIVAPGYPTDGKNVPIRFTKDATESVIYGKIEWRDGVLTQLGSRSAAVWATGASLDECNENVTRLLRGIDGKCHYRTDLC